MFAFTDFCRSGYGSAELEKAIEEIDRITEHEKIYGDGTDFFVFEKAREEQGNEGRKTFLFRKAERSEDGEPSIKVRTKREPPFQVLKGTEEEKYLSDVSSTGLMLSRGEGEFQELLGFSASAMKVLCYKIGLTGPRISDGNSCYRNLSVVELLTNPENEMRPRKKNKNVKCDVPYIDNLVFTTRRYGKNRRFRVVSGVTTGKAHRNRPREVLAACRKIMEMEWADNAEIGEWSFLDNMLSINIYFKGKEHRYTMHDGTETVLTPGIKVIDSDCGKASWTLGAFISTGNGKKYIKTLRKKHDGYFNIEKGSVSWMNENIIPEFERYFEQAEKMEETLIHEENGVLETVRRLGVERLKEFGKKKFRVFESAVVRRAMQTGSCSEMFIEISIIDAEHIVEQEMPRHNIRQSKTAAGRRR